MSENLKDKIKQSLSKSGLPLEYYTYTEYRKNKFSGFQGDFIDDGGLLREIDVLARVKFPHPKSELWINNVVECKWSKDKPWIVYTSTIKKSAAASVAQTIGNEIGQALMWLAAGDTSLEKLELFHPNRRFGFSGNRLEENGSDKRNQIYEAVQSLVTKSVRTSEKYKSLNYGPEPYKFISVSFPTIVVDGQIFESFYDENSDAVEIEEVSHSVLHWRGSNDWQLGGVRIDIVTKSHLREYCMNLRQEFDVLGSVLQSCLDRYINYLVTRDINDLSIPSASRGILGMPRLLRP